MILTIVTDYDTPWKVFANDTRAKIFLKETVKLTANEIDDLFNDDIDTLDWVTGVTHLEIDSSEIAEIVKIALKGE